jgi:hypothetical protein
VLVMRCPDPEPLCKLAGTRAVIETGRKIIGPGRYGEEGTGRLQRAWVADPDRIRNFRPGQAAYLHGAACTYLHIAACRPSPLALPPAPAGPPPVGLVLASGADAPPASGAGLAARPQVPLPGGSTR